jgi:hypothetical protein
MLEVTPLRLLMKPVSIKLNRKLSTLFASFSQHGSDVRRENGRLLQKPAPDIL